MTKMYYCNECNKKHQPKSRKGWEHKKFKNISKSLGKLSTSIEWEKTGKDWKSGTVYLGKKAYLHYKADVHRVTYPFGTEYHITFKVIPDDEKKWLDYSFRHWKWDKPNDSKAFKQILLMSPK